MKRCIVADLHSLGPEILVERMQGQVDSWAFLGDYDDPQILKQIITLGQDKIITIGNHDYALALGDCPISRYTEGREERLIEIWKENENEREFVLDCVDDLEGRIVGLRVIREGKFGNVAYTHAAIGMTLTQSLNDRFYCDEEQESAKADNFRKMTEKSINLMFRGHDHMQGILSSNLDGKDIKKENFLQCVPFMFSRNRRYVVTVGAFVENNCYAIHDEDTNSVVLTSER